MTSIFCWALVLSTLGAESATLDVPHWNADETADIFKVGAFTSANENGWPDGWTNLSAFETQNARLQIQGLGTVTLRAADNGDEVAISTTVDLPPNTEYVTCMVA